MCTCDLSPVFEVRDKRNCVLRRRAIQDGKAQHENNKTQTNRTAAARAATGSSAFPALSLTADAVCFHTGQTIAANHLCWVVEGSKEFKTIVQI